MVNRSVKTIQDTTKLLGAQGINTVFSVFCFIFITRLFTKLEMSALAVFGIITGLSAMFTGLGLVSTCFQRAPGLLAGGEKKKAYALMKTAVIIPTFLSLVAASLIFLFSDAISRVFFKTSDLSVLIRIMAVGVIASKLNENLTHMLRVTGKFGKLGIIQIFNKIPVSILAILLYFSFGINGYIVTLILGQIAAVIFMCYYLKEFIFRRSGLSPLGKVIPYSLPYYAEGFVRFGSMRADQLIVGVLLTPEKLATYYVARRFFDYIFLYIGALSEPLVPKLSELKSQGLQAVENAFNKISRYICFVLIPPCFLVASVSYPLLAIYGGKKYIAGAPLIPILMTAAIAYGTYNIFGITVYILGKPIKQFKQESVASVLNVGLGLLLIMPFNILGLAVARVLSQLGATVFSRRLLRKMSNAKFDRTALKNTLIASTIMAAVIVGLQLAYYSLFLVPLYVAIGVIFFMILFCSNLTSNDIELLENSLPSRLLVLLNIIHFFRIRPTKKCAYTTKRSVIG